jgi:hypothetical protein
VVYDGIQRYTMVYDAEIQGHKAVWALGLSSNLKLATLKHPNGTAEHTTNSAEDHGACGALAGSSLHKGGRPTRRGRKCRPCRDPPQQPGNLAQSYKSQPRARPTPGGATCGSRACVVPGHPRGAWLVPASGPGRAHGAGHWLAASAGRRSLALRLAGCQ